MTWFSTAGRILALVFVAALVGWLYGYPLQAVIVALLLFAVYWLYQMENVQKWLEDPDQVPPDVYGVWGSLLAHIYQLQRRNRDVRERLESDVAYLQNSFASMRDAVVMVDELGAIEWFNEAVQDLLGLRYSQDIGQPLTNLVRQPEFNEYFLGADYATPLEYAVHGEKTRHLRVEITRFGEAKRLLFIRDISVQVQVEQARRDFVANVSHELRTPLTVITGYLNNFDADLNALPSTYHKPVKQMLQQSERMETLLKDLLWLSRIESEERSPKRDLLDMCALLQELRDDLAGAHPEANVSLQLESDSRILGDYREIYSAVSNLANNAIRYSPAGTPIVLSWEKSAENCRLCVRDSGPGIDASHIPRLTERFYRVDDSRSSVTGGTGLGLAIVKHVAAAHDARLTIESVPGSGSTFILEFPPGE